MADETRENPQPRPGVRRVGACHSPTRLLQRTHAGARPSRAPVPFDQVHSMALDVAQTPLDAVAEGFVALRLAYRLNPTNRHLPKALTATVEAFGAAVGAVRELEREVRL